MTELLAVSALAFVAGLVSFTAPCTLPLLPGYVSYVSGLEEMDGGSRRTVWAGAGLFVAGFTLTDGANTPLATMGVALGAQSGGVPTSATPLNDLGSNQTPYAAGDVIGINGRDDGADTVGRKERARARLACLASSLLASRARCCAPSSASSSSCSNPYSLSALSLFLFSAFLRGPAHS